MCEKVKAGIRAAKYLDDNSRYEILELLGQMEGELQAKDIVIAALKNECLRHILLNLMEGRNVLSDPMLALSRDGLTGSTVNPARGDSLQQHVTHKLKVLQTLVEAQKSALKKLTHCLREAETQKANLIKDLDEERRKREFDSAQEEDITYCLEKDRCNLKQELEAEMNEKVRLQAEVENLTNKLQDEQLSKKQIILTLMEDRKKMATLYWEEKKRSEELSRRLREEQNKVQSLGIGLEEESKRSLAMEADLERALHQISSHKEELVIIRSSQKDLEEALRKARQEAEHFKKQLSEAHRVAMSQASSLAATEALTDPYPKWNAAGQPLHQSPSSAINSNDTFQSAKSSAASFYDKDTGLAGNHRLVSLTSTVVRGSTEAGRVMKAAVPFASPPRMVAHHAGLGKKAPLTITAAAANSLKASPLPPPVPPNKPAIYKAISGAIMKLETSPNNATDISAEHN